MAFEKMADHSSDNYGYSFVPKDWNRGDVITENSLDRLENQIKLLTDRSKWWALVTNDSSAGTIAPASVTNNSSYNDSNAYIPTTKYVKSYAASKINALDATAVTLSTTETIASIGETNGIIAVTAQPIALSTTEGVGLVQVGSNIDVDDNGVISVSAATTSNLGLVQVGNNIDVDNGTISIPLASSTTFGVIKSGTNVSITDGAISVPQASTSTKGVVKIGSNLTVSSGVVSVAAATTEAKGVVQIGDNLGVDSGVISVPVATTQAKGVVQIGTNLNVDNGTISVPVATTSSAGAMSANDKEAIDGLCSPSFTGTNATAAFIWVSSMDGNDRSTGWITIDELKTLLGIGE